MFVENIGLLWSSMAVEGWWCGLVLAARELQQIKDQCFCFGGTCPAALKPHGEAGHIKQEVAGESHLSDHACVKQQVLLCSGAKLPSGDEQILTTGGALFSAPLYLGPLYLAVRWSACCGASSAAHMAQTPPVILPNRCWLCSPFPRSPSPGRWLGGLETTDRHIHGGINRRCWQTSPGRSWRCPRGREEERTAPQDPRRWKRPSPSGCRECSPEKRDEA